MFNWSVYPLISSTKSVPRPEIESQAFQEHNSRDNAFTT